MPLTPCLLNFVRQVLISVSWSTLQSLVLAGMVINEWIQVLLAIDNDDTAVGGYLQDLQLQHFRIHASNAEQICLTHSSMLFIHRMVHATPLIELVLENMFLEDEGDLNLVVGILGK